jgi:hypothetical protein
MGLPSDVEDVIVDATRAFNDAVARAVAEAVRQIREGIQTEFDGLTQQVSELTVERDEAKRKLTIEGDRASRAERELALMKTSLEAYKDQAIAMTLLEAELAQVKRKRLPVNNQQVVPLDLNKTLQLSILTAIKTVSPQSYKAAYLKLLAKLAQISGCTWDNVPALYGVTLPKRLQHSLGKEIRQTKRKLAQVTLAPVTSFGLAVAAVHPNIPP